MATRLKLEVDTKGPFFTGQYQKELHSFLDEVKIEAADMVVERIRTRINVVTKFPTGAFSSAVYHERANHFNDRSIRVHYPEALYGPWLEGESSRNATTRFKGYRTFRRARSWARKEVTPFVQSRINQFLSRIG